MPLSTHHPCFHTAVSLTPWGSMRHLPKVPQKLNLWALLTTFQYFQGPDINTQGLSQNQVLGGRKHLGGLRTQSRGVRHAEGTQDGFWVGWPVPQAAPSQAPKLPCDLLPCASPSSPANLLPVWSMALRGLEVKTTLTMPRHCLPCFTLSPFALKMQTLLLSKAAGILLPVLRSSLPPAHS